MTKTHTTRRRALVSFGALATLAACSGTPQVQGQPTRSAMEVLASDSSFERFIEAAIRGGVARTLEGPGPITVFAFTNSGWGDLPVFTRDALMQGSDQLRLTAVMEHLLVDGRHTIASLGGQKREFTTRNGTRITVDPTNPDRISVESSGGRGFSAGVGSVGLRSARLIRQDIEASNGVIHVLDGIIVA